MTDKSLPEKISTDIRQKTFKESAKFLIDKRAHLAQFASAEDLVTADPFPSELNGVLHHLGTLKSALAHTLWSDQFFIGSRLVRELINPPTMTRNAQPRLRSRNLKAVYFCRKCVKIRPEGKSATSPPKAL
jgi:hypothetical protein